MSGSASNGVDYTFLNGSVTINSNQAWEVIEVDALPRFILTNQTVTVTLLMTNDYVPDPTYAWSATILIEPNVFSLVATNILNPIGLDYHTLTDSLLVSVDPDYCASNFVRIDAQGTVSHWADVTDLIYPTPLATVKATANHFQEGATYFCGFGSPATSIGWLSPSGDPSTNNWVPLPDNTSTMGGPLRGPNRDLGRGFDRYPGR